MRFRKVIADAYEVVELAKASHDDVMRSAKKWLRLLDPQNNPQGSRGDKDGRLDPLNGGFEHPQEDQDVVLEKGAGDPDEGGGA